MKIFAIALFSTAVCVGTAIAADAPQKPQAVQGCSTAQASGGTGRQTGGATPEKATPGDTAGSGWQGGGGGAFNGTSGHEPADSSTTDHSDVAKGLDPVAWAKNSARRC